MQKQLVMPDVNNSLVNKEKLREQIHAFENTLHALPDEYKVEMETMHNFANGMYSRTVLMKAGEFIVGKIHKKDHIVVVSAGRCLVVSEEFGTQEILAPCVFVSPPGVKRMLHILEDTVWTTIHATNETDLVKLEEELIAKDYSELPEGNHTVAEPQFSHQKFTKENKQLGEL